MKYKLVLVKAKDWQLTSDPVTEDYDFDIAFCVICGFLTKDTDEYITVTCEIFDLENKGRDTYRGSVTIPKECIIEIKELKEKK